MCLCVYFILICASKYIGTDWDPVYTLSLNASWVSLSSCIKHLGEASQTGIKHSLGLNSSDEPIHSFSDPIWYPTSMQSGLTHTITLEISWKRSNKQTNKTTFYLNRQLILLTYSQKKAAAVTLASQHLVPSHRKPLQALMKLISMMEPYSQHSARWF